MKTINELTQIMTELVAAKGWSDTNSKRKQTPRNLACSLCIESAEVLEHFQWGETIRDKEGLASELADVMLYLLQLAAVSGIDLEDAVMRKVAENYRREWKD